MGFIGVVEWAQFPAIQFFGMFPVVMVCFWVDSSFGISDGNYGCDTGVSVSQSQFVPWRTDGHPRQLGEVSYGFIGHRSYHLVGVLRTVGAGDVIYLFVRKFIVILTVEEIYQKLVQALLLDIAGLPAGFELLKVGFAGVQAV